MPFDRCHLSHILWKTGNQLAYRNSSNWRLEKLTCFQWLARRLLAMFSVVIVIRDSVLPSQPPIRISPRNPHSSLANRLVLQNEHKKLMAARCVSTHEFATRCLPMWGIKCTGRSSVSTDTSNRSACGVNLKYGCTSIFRTPNVYAGNGSTAELMT